MHPASSVIFFTTASGAGYGLLMVLGALALAGVGSPALLFVASLPGFVLVTAGLLASTMHLGHPERAWRAFSQWRSSWLSREGVVAVATYVPAAVGILVWLTQGAADRLWVVVLALTGLLALVTIVCTGMIYASLKPIPRWHNGWVVPIYLAFALATGAAWLAPVLWFAANALFQPVAAFACTAGTVAWVLKLCYWRSIDRAAPAATPGRAIGIEHLGPVRQIEGPHTGANYVMREMGYQVARRHARKLRTIAIIVGGIVAPVLLLAATGVAAGAALALSLLGLVAASLAVLVERWLFFAEAEHLAMLYYRAE